MGIEVNKKLGEFADIMTSPLAGEVCFQCEQKTVRIRKQGEGCNKYPYNLLRFIIILTFFLLCNCTTQAKEPVSIDIGKPVRVAISTNNFKSLLYNQISLSATGNYVVRDMHNDNELLKLGKNDVLTIKINCDSFTLAKNGKNALTNLKAPFMIETVDKKDLLSVVGLRRKGKQAFYRGAFEIDKRNNSQFFLINVIDVEDYLKGVVPNEMPTSFGLEALKAQTIAARNYVLSPRVRWYDEFDVDDSVSSQVYFGANTEEELSNRAVEETKGLVALYDWDLILAQYCSTAGGYTENFENAFSETKTGNFPSRPKPFLRGRADILSVGPLNREEEARLFYMTFPDSYDIKSPYYRWQREWGEQELHDVLEQNLVKASLTGFVEPSFRQGDKLGQILEIDVKTRGVSGKVMELEIVTDKKSYRVYKELVIRRLFTKDGKALPSANVVFENLYNEDKTLNKIITYGGGYGHGVGMSQYGAGFMATSLHKKFDEILKRYYTGITISTAPVILSSYSGQNEVTLNFFAPDKKAYLVFDNKYKIPSLSGVINGEEVCFELEKSGIKDLLPFKRVSRIDISKYIKKRKENTATFYYPCGAGDNKAIRFYIELVEKDDNEFSY